MATILLSAVGLAVGGSIGGSVLGLSSAVIGRAVGAAIGRSIDERLLGSGSAPVETGKVDRFRLTGASDGTPIAQVFGRMRVAGQVIWATRFKEDVTTSGGGKGTSRGPETRDYSYSVSLAIALCEGEITRVGRIWADGVEISDTDLNLRVYKGTMGQGPDPKIEAVEGAGRAPAFRGTAYVVLEDLALGQFGNRVPQFNFEVFRPAAQNDPTQAEDIARLIQGVALIPGTGEYSLATTPVFLDKGYGEQVPANVNSPSGKTDFLTALDALTEELPNCGSVSLVVSWFGDDLRCGHCTIRPKVEQATGDGAAMPWTVTGLTRATAQTVAQIAASPVYGGTPSDQSVIEAIRALNGQGKRVMFYPFILMEQLAGNTLPNPYTGDPGQPALPWRGRITTSRAPGVNGSPDGTAAADAQVADFFGQCLPGQFSHTTSAVTYSGPAEWGMRRFILHYAHLCAAAGGVDAFCIGTEMVALTQIRGATGFPAVQALRQLAAEVKVILGPTCKIGYAADWSEYHGYQPPGTADKLFHLDPLWADPAIDFIGIDNYMPLSDWRDGEDHADAAQGAIYNLDYLTGNVAGGELYNWYYHSPEAQAAQIRTPISDGLGEDWLWRTKDIKGWWSNPHHNRVGGNRATNPTGWVPQSKPIWFTELGCAAIDKGTNEPNKFLDPKSSESVLPRYSNGQRDDFIQMQYLRAMHRHWAPGPANPLSSEYSGRMVDMTRAHVWAWDARPFPWFPLNTELWSDAANYRRGHWLNGRSTSRSLASVVAEVCRKAGITAIDTERLYGLLRGYRVDDTATARAALQPLMLAFGFDVAERDGALVFFTRDGRAVATIDPALCVLEPQAEATISRARAPQAETAGRIRIGYVDADGDYEVRTAEAILPDEATQSVAGSSMDLALSGSEARQTAERWLAEARLARDGVKLALPLSHLHIGAGDVVALAGDAGPARYRIDRLEQTGHLSVEALRVEPAIYRPQETEEEVGQVRPFTQAVPVEALFMDLPLITGEEAPHAPHIAMTAQPWPGSVALYASPQDSDYKLNRIIPLPATVGITLTPLLRQAGGRWDNGPALRVRLVRGALSSAGLNALLAGRNFAAIGNGSTDAWEVFQFRNAELVALRTYDLWLRLRGQAGSDGIMPENWPIGSRFVLLDSIPTQIALSPRSRGQTRHFRWGPSRRPIDDPTYRYRAEAFAGIGLRPYPVCHLRSVMTGAGGIALTWIRRTREDGDDWSLREVPLGEASESYLVRVAVNGLARRETVVTSPDWTYSATMQAEDAATGIVTLAVAQLSERFGPGPFRAIDLTL